MLIMLSGMSCSAYYLSLSMPNHYHLLTPVVSGLSFVNEKIEKGEETEIGESNSRNSQVKLKRIFWAFIPT